MARDMTMERNLRTALVESRQRYKDLVEVSSDFSWETNVNGEFIFVSPKGALGYQAEELINKKAEALEKVKKLEADGTLGEAAVSEMLKTGDREMTIAALAVLSGLKVDSMRTVISNRSAKGMASISWKAGLSAKFSEVLQKNLALILTTDIIRAGGGRYALEDGDMEWQLDFIKDLS